MSKPVIFLSHIHEEKELALIIKNAIEEEFSGFVEVFVSSDGTSIKAGENFLKKIEDGLINCVGGVYLISQASVKKPWINFELGALWIRNALNLSSELPGIPALPFCHSGMYKSELPQPISNLNAIEINKASELEFAFRSLQHALGGRGKLRTNFNDLTTKIIQLELQYTTGDNVKSFFNALFNHNPSEIPEFKAFVRGQVAEKISMPVQGLLQANYAIIKQIADHKLPGLAQFEIKQTGIGIGENGMINTVDVVITFNTEKLKSFLDMF